MTPTHKITFEQRHEKTSVLHMRKQRCRSAAQYNPSPSEIQNFKQVGNHEYRFYCDLTHFLRDFLKRDYIMLSDNYSKN